MPRESNKSSFRIFGQVALSDYFASGEEELQKLILRENDEYILNVNESEYTDYLARAIYISALQVDFQNVRISTYEAQIPAERFPRVAFDVDSGASYWKDVIVFHVPCTGNTNLLRCSRDTYDWHLEGHIEQDELCLEAIDFYKDPDKIKREWQENLSKLKTQYERVIEAVDQHNAGLPQKVEAAFRERKQKNPREVWTACEYRYSAEETGGLASNLLYSSASDAKGSFVQAHCDGERVRAGTNAGSGNLRRHSSSSIWGRKGV